MPLDLRSLLHSRPKLVWRDIHWPAELAPETAAAVLRQLGTDHYVPRLAIESEAVGGVVVHRFGVHAPSAARVEALLKALVPDAALTSSGPRTEAAAAWRVVLRARA